VGWGNELFKSKNNIHGNEEKPGKENKFVNCVECNKHIGIVSVTIYEIEEKHYCSECYSQKIISMAVERDHFDLKQEKTSKINKNEKEKLKPQVLQH
jgi:hypothetical protein